MTLEAQHKQYLLNNPNSKLTFEQWKEQIMAPMLLDAIKQIDKLKENNHEE